jgi:hypothetical protein
MALLQTTHARAGHSPGPRRLVRRRLEAALDSLPAMRARATRMSRRARIAAAAAVAVAVAVPATVLAGAFDGAGQPGQGPLAGVPTARLHPTSAPTAAPLAAKAARSHGVSLAYLETARQTVPVGVTSLRVGPTPRHCRAINGYYFIPNERHTDIISEGDSLAGFRHWIFYRLNQSGAEVHNVVYGVVCIRGAKLLHG